MTDVIAGLSLSLDLSSVVEEALRSAVYSVLSEIKKLIGRNVTELRAAVAIRDSENEKLRVQLHSARQELREQARSRKSTVSYSDVFPSCDEHYESAHSNKSEHEQLEKENEVLAHASPDWDERWNNENVDLQQDFKASLHSFESKYQTGSDLDYNLAHPDSDLELNPANKSLASTPDHESAEHQDTSILYHCENDVSRDLTIVQVKEECGAPDGPSSPTEPELPGKPKPYICGECGKSYLWLKSLKKHQRIHTGESPLSCALCCKHFSSQRLFEDHQRVHADTRPHRCPNCPKTFSHLSNLKKHKLIHTGEKPYHCGLCGKRFRQIQHLKEHSKTHDASKPFRCGECGWGFNHGSNFKRHLLVHTRQKMRHGLGS